MKLFRVFRKGSISAGQICEMLLVAETSDEAARVASEYEHVSKKGFNPNDVVVQEVKLDEPRIISVYSL